MASAKALGGRNLYEIWCKDLETRAFFRREDAGYGIRVVVSE